MKKLFLKLFASFIILFYNSILHSQNSDIPGPTEDYGNQVMKGTIEGTFRYLKSGNVLTYHLPLANAFGLTVSNFESDKIPKIQLGSSDWFNTNVPPSVFQAHWLANQILPIFQNDFGINYGTLHLGVDLSDIPEPDGVSASEFDINNSYIGLSHINGSTFAETDILAHEMCHGYLRNIGLPTNPIGPYTLHEGISDIFSVYAEQKIQSLDWLFGDNIPINYRDFQNPQNTCFLEVQNVNSVYDRAAPLVYWFYLLSTGDTANGIQQMPMKDIVDIVLHAAPLIVNLPQQDYPELRTATLQIAEQNYGGRCTSLYKSMLAAWDNICVYGGDEGCCYTAKDRFIASNSIFSTPQFISGNLIIESGNTLTITNTSIKFAENKGIIVKNGGNLILNMATINSCDISKSWAGIRIENGGSSKIDYSFIYNATIGIDAKHNSILDIDHLNIVGKNNTTGIGLNLDGMVTANAFKYLDISQYQYGVKAINGNTMYEISHGLIQNTTYGVFAQTSPIIVYDYNISSTDYGVYFVYSPGSIIILSNISFKIYGVVGLFSPNLNVESTEITNALNANINSLAVSLVLSENCNIVHNYNLIKGKRNAISAWACYGTIIEDNNIEVDGIQYTTGGPVSITWSPGSSVSNNNINATHAAYGIQTDGNDNTMILNNDVFVFSKNPERAAAIRSGGSMEEHIENNIVHGLFNTSGILGNNSMGNHYICNHSSAQADALSINFQSDQQEIRANTLDASGNDILIRSEIGRKIHQGNEFLGGNTLAETLSPAALDNSLFFVDETKIGHYYMPSIPIPGNEQWFIQDEDVAEGCDNIQIGPNWSPFDGDQLKICNYWSSLKLIKIAHPEKFFINLFHLLKYSKVKQRFTIPNCILLDPVFQNLCGITKMVDINLALTDISKNDINTAALLSLQKDYSEQSNDGGRASVKLQIQNEMLTLLPQYESEAESDSFRLDSIDQEIDQINCADIIITKWMEIWKLYIKYLKGDLDSNDKSVLENHSLACADLYGDAIHLARSLVNNYSDTDYDVYDGCLDESGEPRYNHHENDLEIELTPNPTYGIINVRFSTEFIGNLFIYNLNGRLIQSRNIDKKNLVRLDVSNENSGIYFIKLISLDGILDEFKIILIK